MREERAKLAELERAREEEVLAKSRVTWLQRQLAQTKAERANVAFDNPMYEPAALGADAVADMSDNGDADLYDEPQFNGALDDSAAAVVAGGYLDVQPEDGDAEGDDSDGGGDDDEYDDEDDDADDDSGAEDDSDGSDGSDDEDDGSDDSDDDSDDE